VNANPKLHRERFGDADEVGSKLLQEQEQKRNHKLKPVQQERYSHMMKQQELKP